MANEHVNKVFDACKIINFRVNSRDGNLVPIEGGVDVPFDIKKVCYIYGINKDSVRGLHCNEKLKSVFICVSGSCDFTLSDGSTRETFHLDNPSQGLYMEGRVWKEFTNFSDDCVIITLESEHYDEADYIRDYDAFLKICRTTTI